MSLKAIAYAALRVLAPALFASRKQVEEWLRQASGGKPACYAMAAASAYVLFSGEMLARASFQGAFAAGGSSLIFAILAIGEEVFFRHIVQGRLKTAPQLLLYSLLMPFVFASNFSQYFLLAGLYAVIGWLSTKLAERFSVAASIGFRLASLAIALLALAAPSLPAALAMLFLPPVILLEKHGKSPAGAREWLFGITRRNALGQAAEGLGLSAAVFLTLALASHALSAAGIADSELVSEALRTQTHLSLLVIMLVAPLAEEVLFRGFLQKYFGVLATSAVFAALHYGFGSVAEVILAFLFSLLVGEYVRKRRLLLPAIIAHALLNAYAVMVVTLRGG